jgi:hypothetical protein
MTGPIKLGIFVASCTVMLLIVVATEGNPLVVVAVVLGAIFLTGRLAGRQ